MTSMGILFCVFENAPAKIPLSFQSWLKPGWTGDKARQCARQIWHQTFTYSPPPFFHLQAHLTYSVVVCAQTEVKTHLRKQQQKTVTCHKCITVQVIIMYIYHALTDILSAHMVHINLNRIFCTYTEQSPTNAIYIKPNKNRSECNPFMHTRHWSLHTCTHKDANNAVRKTTLTRKHPTFNFETISTERERVNELGYI